METDTEETDDFTDHNGSLPMTECVEVGGRIDGQY